MMEYRRSEVEALLQSGKIIFSFLTPRYEVVVTRDNKHLGSPTNYCWLPENYERHFVDNIVDSQGSVLKLIDKKSPFANFYLAFKGEHYFTAYLNIDSSKYAFGRVFITNSTNHIAGFFTELLNGLVVFLPYYHFNVERRAKFEGVLLDILKMHFRTGIRAAPPDWVKNYEVPGTDKLDRKIDEVQRRIKRLELEASEIEVNRTDLEQYRALLYEQGLILQDKVLEALRLMGFRAHTVIAENTDYDVVLESEEGRAIAEVEGKDEGSIHKEKIVVDPKNWTLPLGVEFTRKEVYYAQEAQKFRC